MSGTSSGGSSAGSTAPVVDPLPDVWGAQEVCKLVEDAVRRWLPVFLPPDLDAPKVWEQLPNADAMTSAVVPAVAVSTPGLADDVDRSESRTVLDLTWAVMVSVWVRGADDSHSATTSALRRYVKAITAAVLAGGRDHNDEWALTNIGFDAAREQARTLQFGFVQINVPVWGAIDVTQLPLEPDAPALPLLEHTYVTITPREKES